MGGYDIIGDLLVGWVEKIPYFSNAGTEVQALKNGKSIATYDAIEQRGSCQMTFSMPLRGDVTLENIAREVVIIVAKNLRGDSGALTLNGATRLELIRDYMGRPIVPILDLDFTRGGNSLNYLGAGWARSDSKSEDEFTWATEDNSFVRLPAILSSGDYAIRLRYAACITDFVPRQRLEFAINDQIVGSFTEDEPGQRFREVRFDWTDIKDDRTLTLRIHHPDAFRPCDYEQSTDGRRLSFRVRRLSFVRELGRI